MTHHVADVPLVDLKRPHAAIAEDLAEEFERIFSGMRLFLGPNVQTFQHDFAEYVGSKHCVGVSDGTEAIYLALRALDVGPGDEVITVSHTFFATVEAILLTGATPVFVDVDATTFTMNVPAVERAITARTKVIMPVHLYGLMADMDGIMDVAGRHGLRVVEDSSQAHGARRDGKAAGTVGDIGTFSFYYSKNLGAYGEAGGIVTDDDDLAARVAVLRDHGSRERYLHEEVGVNGRLDEVQAAVLRLKLPRLDEGNQRRRDHARRYSKLLESMPVQTPELFGADHVFHLYVIRTLDRDALQAHLKEQGIHSGIHYPVPCHLQPALAGRAKNSRRLPVTEKVASEILSLPMFPELSDAQIDRVVGAIESFFASRLSTSVDAAS